MASSAFPRGLGAQRVLQMRRLMLPLLPTASRHGQMTSSARSSAATPALTIWRRTNGRNAPP